MIKIFMVAAILFCGTKASAQEEDNYETKNEIAVSIGGATNTQIINVFSEMFSVLGEVLVTGIVTGGHYIGNVSYENEKNIPPLSVEYFRRIDPTISIGGIAAFNGEFHDMYCNFQRNSGDGTATTISKEKVGTGKKYYMTLMPAAKFDWLRKKNVGIYSKVAVGATLMKEREVQEVDGKKEEIHDDTDVMFNFQASLLGVEVGSLKLRGFAELGVGEQGIIQAGIRYKF